MSRSEARQPENFVGLFAGGCAGLTLGSVVIAAALSAGQFGLAVDTTVRYLALGFIPLLALSLILGFPLLIVARRLKMEYWATAALGFAFAIVLGILAGIIVALLTGPEWLAVTVGTLVTIAIWISAFSFIPGRWLSRHLAVSAVLIAITTALAIGGAVVIIF